MMNDIKPIRTAADYDLAMAEVERLWDATEGSPESDRLDILVTLIEKYEEQKFPIEFPDPIDAILFRMEQQNLTRKDLEPMIGPRNRVSEILNRKRALSVDMIRMLNERLRIPAEVLIRSNRVPIN
jgi:HTH-type transcriptional regulator/antitoxin HigA